MCKKNFISEIFLKNRHEKSLQLLHGIQFSRILDVGCDGGHFLRRLAERFPSSELYGCDPDEKSVAEARKACPKATITLEDFMKLDSQPVDLVAMLEVLEHSPKPKAMLKKAASLIKKDGHIIVSIPRPELLRWRIVWGIWSNTLGRRWRGQHSHLTEEELMGLARECGLKVEKRSRFFFGCISIMLFRLA